jgi:hypothetical protein
MLRVHDGLMSLISTYTPKPSYDFLDEYVSCASSSTKRGKFDHVMMIDFLNYNKLLRADPYHEMRAFYDNEEIEEGYTRAQTIRKFII